MKTNDLQSFNRVVVVLPTVCGIISLLLLGFAGSLEADEWAWNMEYGGLGRIGERQTESLRRRGGARAMDWG
jgi:hypothetical protein